LGAALPGAGWQPLDEDRRSPSAEDTWVTVMMPPNTASVPTTARMRFCRPVMFHLLRRFADLYMVHTFFSQCL
jgi:hypothetical protein